MKTTILLTAYQGEAFLPRQLTSLLAQTEPDFDILYQDDGSGDKTPEVLQAWAEKDPRIHPGREQGWHLGAAGNFFSLLRQTDADWILFCDQDDIWLPEKLTLLRKAALETQRQVASALPLLLHSDASLIDENDQPLAPSFFRLQGWDPAATGLNRLLVQNNVTGCTMMVNRPLADLVLRHGDPEKMFMHDWFFALTAAAFGKICFVNRPLIQYRQHGHNAIGASKTGMLGRGWEAFRNREQVRQRLSLNYTHTRAFREAYGAALPPAARETVDAFLATESLPRLRKIRALRSQGFLMQSSAARAGQFLFG